MDDLRTCNHCGWVYPNPHPSAKHRRNHKKNCGKMKNFELVRDKPKEGENSSDEDHHAKVDNEGIEQKSTECQSVPSVLTTESQNFISKSPLCNAFQKSVPSICGSEFETQYSDLQRCISADISDAVTETCTFTPIISNQMESTMELRTNNVDDSNQYRTKVLGLQEEKEAGNLTQTTIHKEVLGDKFAKETLEGRSSLGIKVLAQSDVSSHTTLSSDTMLVCTEEVFFRDGVIKTMPADEKNQTGYMPEDEILSDQACEDRQSFHAFNIVRGHSINGVKILDQNTTESVDLLDKAAIPNGDPAKHALMENTRSNSEDSFHNTRLNISPDVTEELDGSKTAINNAVSDPLDKQNFQWSHDLDKKGPLRTENALEEQVCFIPNERSSQESTHSSDIEQACNTEEKSHIETEKTVLLVPEVTVIASKYAIFSSELIEWSTKHLENHHLEASKLTCDLDLISLNRNLEGVVTIVNEESPLEGSHSCVSDVKENSVQDGDTGEKPILVNISENLKLPDTLSDTSMFSSNQSIQQHACVIITERVPESNEHLEGGSMSIIEHNGKDSHSNSVVQHDYHMQDAVNIERNLNSVMVPESSKQLSIGMSPNLSNQSPRQHSDALISDKAIKCEKHFQAIGLTSTEESTVNEIDFSDMVVKDSYLQAAVDLEEIVEVSETPNLACDSNIIDTNSSNGSSQKHFCVLNTERVIHSAEKLDAALIMESNGKKTRCNARVVEECGMQDMLDMEDNPSEVEVLESCIPKSHLIDMTTAMGTQDSVNIKERFSLVRRLESSNPVNSSSHMSTYSSNQRFQEPSDVLITKRVINSGGDQKEVGLTSTTETLGNAINSNTTERVEVINIIKMIENSEKSSILSDTSIRSLNQSSKRNSDVLAIKRVIKSEQNTEDTHSSDTVIVNESDSLDSLDIEKLIPVGTPESSIVLRCLAGMNAGTPNENSQENCNITNGVESTLMKENAVKMIDFSDMVGKEGDKIDSVDMKEKLMLIKMLESSQLPNRLTDMSMSLTSQSSQQNSDMLGTEKLFELNGSLEGIGFTLMVERDGKDTYLEECGMHVLGDIKSKLNTVKMEPASSTVSTALEKGDNIVTLHEGREEETANDTSDKPDSESSEFISLDITPIESNENEGTSTQLIKLMKALKLTSEREHIGGDEHNPGLQDSCSLVGGIQQFQSLSDPATRLDLGKAMSADNSPDKPIYPTERSSSLRVTRKVFDTEDLKAPSPEAWQELSASETGSGRKNETVRMEELNQTFEVHEASKSGKSRTALRNLMAKERPGKTSKNSVLLNGSIASLDDNSSKVKTKSFWAHCLCCSTVH